MDPKYSTVLVVDDEPSVRRELCEALSSLQFVTVEAARGEEAMSLLRRSRIHAVLLDSHMPGLGGVETCRCLRRVWRRLPILMLSVSDSEDDKIEALDAGADDCMTKPCQIRELTARLRAAIRRTQIRDSEPDEPIFVGDIELDPIRRSVQKGGRSVHLTPKEFEVLHYLMAHSGQPIVHARLLNSVWGPASRGDREYLRTFIRQLRVKLEDDPANPEYLLTDMHIGYRFHNRT